MVQVQRYRRTSTSTRKLEWSHLAAVVRGRIFADRGCRFAVEQHEEALDVSHNIYSFLVPMPVEPLEPLDGPVSEQMSSSGFHCIPRRDTHCRDSCARRAAAATTISDPVQLFLPWSTCPCANAFPGRVQVGGLAPPVQQCAPACTPLPRTTVCLVPAPVHFLV